MKAAVCRAFGEPLTIEDVTLAPPGPGEVLVDIAVCAVCHSDISYIDGDWGGPLPALYGHEASGVVAAVGDGVLGVAPGDHVIVTLIRWCGECRMCLAGLHVACETSFALDEQGPIRDASGAEVHQSMRTGAFAEQVVVHQSQVVVIENDVPMDAAALFACGIITGVGAVTNTAGVEAGSHVVVIGTGGVGLNTVQGAVIAGAATITAVDLEDSKLAAAVAFGATHTVNAVGDVRKAVRTATGGAGADYVFVTVGVKAAIDQSFGLLGAGGAVVLVGIPANGVMSQIDPGKMAARNQRVLGSKMGTARIRDDIPRLIAEYQAGRIKVDELITGRYPLADINEAIASVVRGEALRNVIVFGE